MSDTYDDPDNGAAAAGYPAVIQQPTVGDPDRAAGFLRQHSEARQKAESTYEDIMKQRSDAVASARATLDKTIDEMRAKHDGAGAGSINLPLLALGAGMLSGVGAGQGNFGAQLGRGLNAMGRTIQSQRAGDSDFLGRIAELQQRSATMADVPLKDAAAFAKAQSLKEQGNQEGIERALIQTKADRPQPIGSTGLVIMPGGKIVNAITGQEVGGGAGGAGIPAQGVGSDLHGEEYLKTITDPTMRAAIKGYGDYTADLPKGGARSPMMLQNMQQLFAMAQQYNPDFSSADYDAIKKGKKDWTGNGQSALQQRSAAATAGHLGAFQESAAGLDNSAFQKYNTVANWAKQNAGSPAVSKFLADKQAVMTEMSSFLGKGHPAEGQIQAWSKTVDEANSPAQLQAAFNEFADIMHTQAAQMANAKTRDTGAKKPLTADDIYGDSAKTIRDILGTDIGSTGGRFAAVRRGENRKLEIQGKPQLPAPTPEQWEAGVKALKKDPKSAATFDNYFGPGAAKRVLGR